MTTTIEEEHLTQPSYPYSLKLESTQKGVRIHTHVYGNSTKEVIDQSMELYRTILTRLRMEGVAIAPMNPANTNGSKE
jgi:hypothetical protein